MPSFFDNQSKIKEIAHTHLNQSNYFFQVGRYLDGIEVSTDGINQVEQLFDNSLFAQISLSNLYASRAILWLMLYEQYGKNRQNLNNARNDIDKALSYPVLDSQLRSRLYGLRNKIYSH